MMYSRVLCTQWQSLIEENLSSLLDWQLRNVILDALLRITNSSSSDYKLLQIIIQRSLLVSVDIVYALHPNYRDNHELLVGFKSAY